MGLQSLQSSISRTDQNKLLLHQKKLGPSLQAIITTPKTVIINTKNNIQIKSIEGEILN